MPRVEFPKVDAIDSDRSAARREQLAQELDECRLAGTGRALDRNEFTRLDREVECLDDRRSVVARTLRRDLRLFHRERVKLLRSRRPRGVAFVSEAPHPLGMRFRPGPDGSQFPQDRRDGDRPRLDAVGSGKQVHFGDGPRPAKSECAGVLAPGNGVPRLVGTKLRRKVLRLAFGGDAVGVEQHRVVCVLRVGRREACLQRLASPSDVAENPVRYRLPLFESLAGGQFEQLVARLDHIPGLDKRCRTTAGRRTLTRDQPPTGDRYPVACPLRAN